MQPTLPSLSHILLTLHKRIDHLSHLVKFTQHNTIPVHKPMNLVAQLRLGAKVADKSLNLPKIMSRHPRKKVMHGLELQTTVQEIQPGRAIDIHGSTELALRERLSGAEISGRHAPVRQGDLHVQEHGGDVGEENKGDADWPGG